MSLPLIGLPRRTLVPVLVRWRRPLMPTSAIDVAPTRTWSRDPIT